MTQESEATSTVTNPDNIDQFFGKLNDAMDMVSTKLIEVAPEAADALLSLVQFKGAFSIAVGFLLILSVIPLFFVWRRLARVERDATGDAGMCAIFGTISCVGVFLFGITAVFSFYNWVSAFYPEGAVALKALEAVGVAL